MRKGLIFYFLLGCVFNFYSQSRVILPVMHNGPILSFDESIHVDILVTSSSDGGIKLWEKETGKEYFSILFHEDEVKAVKFVRNERFLLSAAANGWLAVHDVRNGEFIDSLTLKDHVDGMVVVNDSLAFAYNSGLSIQLSISNDGKITRERILQGTWASYSFDKDRFPESLCLGALDARKKELLTMNESRTKLYLKKWSDEKAIMKWTWSDEEIQTAKFSIDGKYIFVGMISHEWKVIDRSTGSVVFEDNRLEGAVTDFSFHPLAQRVLISSDDFGVREFDLESREYVFEYRFSNADISGVSACYSNQGKYMTLFDFMEKALFFDAQTKELKYEYKESFEPYHLVMNSLNDDAVYIFHARFWRAIELPTGNLKFQLSFSPFSFLNKFIGKKDWIISSSYGRTFIIDSKTGKNLYAGKYKTRSMSMALLDESHNRLILGGADNIFSWDYLKEDSLQPRVSGREGYITCMQWSKDSSSFYASSIDRKVVKYNAQDFSVQNEYFFNAIENEVMHFTVVEEENTLIMVGSDKCIHFYNLTTGELQKKIETESPYLHQARLNHARTQMMVTSPLGLARLYEYPSMQLKFQWDEPGLMVNECRFSIDDQYVAIARADKKVVLMSCRTGQLVREFTGHQAVVEVVDFSSDNRYLVSSGRDTQVIVWDIKTGNAMYNRINLLHLAFGFSLDPIFGEYLLVDGDGHFEGTSKARDLIYLSCGLEIIELSQLKDALYVPGLVEKIMSGQPILYPKLSELEICGTLPLIEKKEDGPYHYTITPRKLGLKRVEVYVNGKRVMMKSKEELKKKEEHYDWNIEEKEIQKFFIPGEENQVKVIGIVQQGNNEMQSRGVVEEVESTEEEKQHPTFYGLMVGVSDYKDDRLDLKYPTKDSKDLGQVMESAAKKLLNTTTENHVKMYYVNSEVKGENGYATPEREGVKKALQAISKEARAEDVVMIFFAGHGVMEGDKDKRFTFLTAESTKENLVGISTKDLEEWMSGTNGYLPNKTILIFDACNSGQATEELMAMARDDDETQRIRQVEDLKDKSGMFIMSASAANQSAYELPRYGHGLLTYSLLKTLKTSSSTLDEEKFINVQKWFLETETTMDNMTRELGIEQEAQPFGRGNIRVGELDEEIRGGIEIQQEKPMVYCANALNLSTDDDDLMLKKSFNEYLKNYQVRGDAKVSFAIQEQGAVRVNFKYNVVDGKVQCLASIFKDGEKQRLNWEGKTTELDQFFKQVLWMVE